jgi:hypothetical protein
VGTRSPTRTITLTNAGFAPAVFGTATLLGPAVADFPIVADGCSNVTVPPRGSCEVRVAFAPTAAGDRKARIQLLASTDKGGTTVNLSGTGTTATVPPPLPGAPTAVIAAAGDGRATVAFAPAPDGETPVAYYTATASPGGQSGSSAGDPIVVDGLTNGVAYTFTVTASTWDATGPASVPSAPVVPTAARRITEEPPAPTGVRTEPPMFDPPPGPRAPPPGH